MAPIVGFAALAVVVIAPLWTARAVLGAVLGWLVRHSDRAETVAPEAPASSAAARRPASGVGQADFVAASD
jgi:hypothetical protein